jgi:hypothetical protein
VSRLDGNCPTLPGLERSAVQRTGGPRRLERGSHVTAGIDAAAPPAAIFSANGRAAAG